MEGLDHKGCGRLDYTGRRVLRNYRTFKDRKGLGTRYCSLLANARYLGVKLLLLRVVSYKCNAKDMREFIHVCNEITE